LSRRHVGPKAKKNCVPTQRTVPATAANRTGDVMMLFETPECSRSPSAAHVCRALPVIIGTTPDRVALGPQGIKAKG